MLQQMQMPETITVPVSPGPRSAPPDHVEDFATSHQRLIKAGMHPLRAAHTLWNLSMYELANASGVSRRTILKIEHGQRKPHPSTRRLLVSYFGMDASTLGLI